MQPGGRFPFWAFDYPNLSSISVHVDTWSQTYALTLEGRFLVPHQRLEKLNKLVLSFSPAITALFRSPHGPFLNEMLPNLAHLEVRANESFAAECFQNLPSKLETLIIEVEAANVDVDVHAPISAQSIAQLPRL